MAAAEAKSTKRWFIGATIIILLIVGITVIPNNLMFHYYFQRAGLFSNILGVLIAAAWIIYLWKWSYNLSYGKRSSAGLNIGILVIGLILMLCLLFGFNTDLTHYHEWRIR